MPTVDEIKAFLASIGVPVPPDAIIALWIQQIGQIQACLDGAGYPPYEQSLIYYYMFALFALSFAAKYVSSESAPSGASRSYRYNSLIDSYRSMKALLATLDTSGCTDDLVPAEPGPSAGLWVSKGGCC